MNFESENVTGLILLDATDLSNNYVISSLLIINEACSFVYDGISKNFKTLVLPKHLVLESYKSNIN